MTVIYFLTCILLCVCIETSFGLSCKNENNEDVDWFILYKLPKIKDDSSPFLAKGTSYVYINSLQPEEWKLSSHEIIKEDSMLGNTWKDMKKNEKSATYLIYNDEVPEPFSGSTVGHLKGYFVFDESSGYWLTHSIPKFGLISHYEYPDNAVKYGQYAFCINFKTSQLDSICNHLLYCNPKIYISSTTEGVLSQLGEKAKSLFTDDPDFIRSPPFLRISNIESAGQQMLSIIAKDNQLNQDLYSDIIAQNLTTSLIAETWQRGSGTVLASHCESVYTVNDAKEINLNAEDEGNAKKNIKFDSIDDHSKWAISISGAKSWVCVADLNRVKSQMKRGGGAICFQSNSVWDQFKNIVAETDNCDIS